MLVAEMLGVVTNIWCRNPLDRCTITKVRFPPFDFFPELLQLIYPLSAICQYTSSRNQEGIWSVQIILLQ